MRFSPQRAAQTGLLFNLGYTLLTDSQKQFTKDRLIVFAVAPAKPISWINCLEAENVLSDKDRMIMPITKKYLNNPEYDITILKCISPWREFSAGFADHAFLGTTYRTATQDNIDRLREKRGFCDVRKR